VRDKFPGVGELFKYNIDGKQFGMKTLGLPTVGVFKIRSEKPFAAYSFGYGWCDSYGYPTSAALADLEKPDTIPPNPPWFLDCYGYVNDDGKTEVTDMPDDAAIRSNLAKIIYHRDSSFNYVFWYNEFIPGEDRSTEWGLKIINQEEDARGLITFTDRRGNDTTLDIRFYAIKLAMEPEYWDFGKLRIGDVVEHDFLVRNLSENGLVKLTDLNLKWKDQDFELFDHEPLPYNLQPLATFPFKVRFTARTPGEFRDSIGVGDTCFFWYKSLVEARTGAPEITVGDHDFGRVRVGVKKTWNIDIFNDGDLPLEITGYTGPANSTVYELPDIVAMSPADPLVLVPNERYTFTVNFTPDAEIKYPDVITFHNNASRTDSLCILDGEGMKPGLEVTSFDWKRRTIDRRPAFPAGPYDYDGIAGEEVIWLRNSGSQEVTVTKATIVSDYQNRGSAFEFEDGNGDINQIFRNVVIPKEDSILFVVRFHPTEVGIHELVLDFENTANVKRTSTLKGIGILNDIATNDAYFGTTIVNDFASPNPPDVPVRFSNPRRTDPVDGTDVSDILTITNIVVESNGDEISTDGTTYGTEGFMFNEMNIEHSTQGTISLGSDIILQPDEYIEITDPKFVATNTNGNSASLRAEHDADAVAISVWTGDGLSQGITSGGGEEIICIGEEITIDCFVENTGSGSIDVTKLYMDPIEQEFSWDNPADVATPFTLGPNERRDFKVKFYPLSVVNKQIEIVFENTTEEQSEIRTTVRGSSVHYDRNTSSEVSKSLVTIGDEYTYTINLDETGVSNLLATVSTIDISIKYKTDFMKVDPKAISIGGSDYNTSFTIKANSIVIQEVDANKHIDELTLTLEATGGGTINTPGQLLKVGFRVFLPWYHINDQSNAAKETVVEITHSVIATQTTCVTYTSDPVSVTLNPTCVYDLRQIVYTGEAFALNQITPNPVGSFGADIVFSVGLESMTNISIYNSSGSLVAIPVSGIMSPGQYRVNLPIEIMTSGTYICKMSSGPFNKTRKIVVSK
jgi:hypothetical protein